MVAPPLSSAQSTIFDIGRTKATSATVTLSTDPAPLPVDTGLRGPMLDQIDGVIASLTTGVQMDALRRCAGSVVPAPKEPGVRFAVVHLFGFGMPEDLPRKMVEIVRQADGDWFAHELEPTAGGVGGGRAARPGQAAQPARWAALKGDAFAACVLNWSMYRGGWPKKSGGGAEQDAKPVEGAKPPVPGTVFELERPYTPGLFIMTKAMLGERLRAGGTTDLEGTTRKFGDDAIHVRLPTGWSAHQPAGLLVFVHAMDDGRPVPPMFAACDELGLIVAGADGSGNDRAVADRYQLALDVVATVSARYPVDPQRVYITGISGGGKVSSIMQAGWPDVFHGALPIVGLGTYQNVPTGEEGKFWPAHFTKPKRAQFGMLQSRRIAAITGDKDFNHAPIVGAVEVYSKDRCAVKLFDYPGMGHELPTAERFTEAMRWVDEPARTVLDKQREGARAAWAKYEATHPDPAAEVDSAALGELVKITRLYAWTPEAWKAVGILRK